jgi:hypothetical protein
MNDPVTVALKTGACGAFRLRIHPPPALFRKAGIGY